LKSLRWFPKFPNMRHQQNQETGAQEQDQSDAAQPLKAGEAGVGGFNLTVLLISFSGARDTTLR
jgi:hypothetical protein